MHLYLKHQSSSTYGSKDIAQVKVFQNQIKVQDQGHKIKCFGTIEKASSQCISISSIKALVLMIQKIQPRLKFFKTRSKFKIKITRSKVLKLKERSLHNASKSLVHMVQKIQLRLKFFKTRSKFKIKVTRSNFLVPKERSLHNASISKV